MTLQLRLANYRLHLVGQVWPATWFCKQSFIGAQSRPFTYVLSLLVSGYNGRVELLQQRPNGAHSLKCLLCDCLQEKLADHHLELLLFITILIFNLRFCPCGGLSLKSHRELRAVFGPERKKALVAQLGRHLLRFQMKDVQGSLQTASSPHCCPRDF